MEKLKDRMLKLFAQYLSNKTDSNLTFSDTNNYAFSILTWIIPWTEEPGRLQPMGSKESVMTK